MCPGKQQRVTRQGVFIQACIPFGSGGHDDLRSVRWLMDIGRMGERHLIKPDHDSVHGGNHSV
jgi:hypothetical protein